MCWYHALFTVFLLPAICFQGNRADAGARVEIVPSAFLSSVTQSVQLTCRPQVGPIISEVISMEVFKQSGASSAAIDNNNIPSRVPVVSYVTAHSPVVETQGQRLGVSASGSYDSSHPEKASLTVTFYRPTEAASGVYVCELYELDQGGLLQTYSAQATLTSLARNETVPGFYQTLLRELRSDLDNLTSDLDTVQRSQILINKTSSTDMETKLSSIDNHQTEVTELIHDVSTHLNAISQTNTSLNSQLDNLRNITPVSPVYFHAIVTSSYVTPGTNQNVVFNSLMENSYNSSSSPSSSSSSFYSRSSGVFTVPVNGTYLLHTTVTGESGLNTYASLVVNGGVLSSLLAHDDQNYAQSSTSVIVELTIGDAVSVVKMSGGKIYGSYSFMNHVSYFMGVLLW